MDSIVKMGVKQAGTGPRETWSESRPAAEQAGGDSGRGGSLPQERARSASAGPGSPRASAGYAAAGGAGWKAAVPGEDAERKKEAEADARKAEQEQAAEKDRKDREARRLLGKHYRMIAGYVIATVVICYILLMAAGNLGSILKSLGRAAVLIGAMLQPLFWGFVIAYILSPVVEILERRLRGVPFLDRKGKSRRTPAVLITCLIVVLLLVLLLSLVVSAVSRSLRVASPEDMIAVVQSFAGTLQSFQQTIMARIAELNIDSAELNSALRQIGEKIAALTGGFSAGLGAAVGHIGGFLSSAVFAVIFAVYFMLDSRGLARYWDRVLFAVGGKKVRRGFHILAEDADAVFSGYIRGQLIDAILMAFLVSISLSVIGVQYAVIIGVLSGIGNLIPYVGPIVAYGSTILVCLLTGDLRRLLVAIVILFIVQTVDGNVINPRLLSSSVDVHPMLVIAALIIGGAVGGVVGMLFAVPVAAFLRIQFDKVVDRLVEARAPEKEPRARKKKRAAGSGAGKTEKAVKKQASGSSAGSTGKTEKAAKKQASESSACSDGKAVKAVKKQATGGSAGKTVKSAKKQAAGSSAGSAGKTGKAAKKQAAGSSAGKTGNAVNKQAPGRSGETGSAAAAKAGNQAAEQKNSEKASLKADASAEGTAAETGPVS